MFGKQTNRQHSSIAFLFLGLVVASLFSAVRAIPIPYPRYGAFVDEIRTTEDATVLRAKIACYNGTGRGADSATPESWTHATIHLPSFSDASSAAPARVTPDAPDAELLPGPEPALDPMAGHELQMDGGNATLVDPLGEMVISLNFSDLLTRAQEAVQDEGLDLSVLPFLSFVSQKLDRAYVLLPDYQMSGGGYDIMTVMVVIALSDPAEAVFSSFRHTIAWDFFIYDFASGMGIEIETLFDQEQLVLLPPSDPFSGDGYPIAFVTDTDIGEISQTNSYYFPFPNPLDAMTLDDDGNATLNTLYEIHHEYSLQEDIDGLDLDEPEWEVMVPEAYELLQKSMTGEVKRRITLDQEDVLAQCDEATPSPRPTTQSPTTPGPTTQSPTTPGPTTQSPTTPDEPKKSSRPECNFLTLIPQLLFGWLLGLFGITICEI